MKTLDEYIDEQLENDAGYAEAQKEAEAELTLSERLLDLRDGLGLSQRAAAEKIGIKAPHLSRLEASTSLPTLHTIWKLADAYGACFTFGPNYSIDVRPVGFLGYDRHPLKVLQVQVESAAYGPQGDEDDVVSWRELGTVRGERNLLSSSEAPYAA